MSEAADPHLGQLADCLRNAWIGSIILFISESLFFYDYILTIDDELTHIWGRGRLAIGSILYAAARYLGFASCILSNLKTTLSISNALTCVRVAAIVSSEAILAIRTWAVWGKNRWIMGILVVFAIIAIVSAANTVRRDMGTSELKSTVLTAASLLDQEMDQERHECLVAVSTVGNGWVVPFSMTIMYEVVTIGLTISRIVWWRRRLPTSRRAPLLDTLWKDGVIYFALMLGIGALNTGLVVASTAPSIRQNVSQLQTSLHSMLSTRIVLHLANSGLGVKSIHTTVTTSLAPDTVQFTTVIRSDYELATIDATRDH